MFGNLLRIFSALQKRDTAELRKDLHVSDFLFLPVIPAGLMKDVNSYHKYSYSLKGTGIVTFFLVLLEQGFIQAARLRQYGKYQLR